MSETRRHPAHPLVALLAVLALTAIGCSMQGGSADPRTSSASPPSDGGPRAAPNPHLGREVPPQGGGAAESTSAPASSAAPSPSTVGPQARPPVSDTLVRSTAGSGRRVALTFDDGPSAEWTPKILDLLDRYGVKATFCVVGEQARAYPALVRKIVAKGHRLCDHTETHDERLARMPEDQVRKQIGGARDAILAAAPDAELEWFRAPGGGWSSAIKKVAVGYGMKPLDWSVDSRDWERKGVDTIVATVQRQLRPGGVVLMHDGGGERSQSVAALARLLPWLVQQGYSFDYPG
ncbi:polysaccharide deacetylase family protein [Yinghuangia seranimata]|uniref:polysaccharide deacetylase family protein n=1 Tax=Yinghuangia seranimata TaxID=408067 RepID=UPI00248B6AFA|nr:polysaccharide deacetylase family protein [Yinghuangia seranimata]MDI2131911.1 polysaccharide deacetylase family protein [Yinghuangia seranimata]